MKKVNVSDNKKSRNSNIELLRILSMFLIVLHHFSIHGLTLNTDKWVFLSAPSWNQMLGQFMVMGGKVGVDIFVIISGYFLIYSTFKFSKVIDLEIQVWTYSFICFIGLATLGLIPFSLGHMIRSFFPVMYSQYWFVTAYMIMYIFSPFFNKLILSLSKIKFQLLIFLLTFILTVLPSFVKATMENSQNIIFILLYCIGAYVRIYEHDINLKKMGRLFLWGGILSATTSFLLLDFLGIVTKIWTFSNHATHFFDGNSPFILMISLGSLLLMLNAKSFSNKFINECAGASFGVYLLHDNLYLGPLIWKNIFHVHNLLQLSTIHFIFSSLIIVVSVYIVGTVIELLRKVILGSFFNGKMVMKIVKSIWKNNESKFRR